MIDAVLSYHTDPISCGVTKFSQQLATRLGVPWAGMKSAWSFQAPLWNIKWAECGFEMGRGPIQQDVHDVFFHDWDDWACHLIAKNARRVFAANTAIAEEIRPYRPDVIAAWCPSLVEAQPREPISVLSFGMASKFRADLYATLKDKLDATGEEYVVYISAALHEGTTFADASAAFEALRKMFGPRFVFLGTLSDEAMVDRLRTCTYVAAFFEQGLRENNTSVHAAIEHGATVLTNWDAHTPLGLCRLTHPIEGTLPHVAQRRELHECYGWDKLVDLIRA